MASVSLALGGESSWGEQAGRVLEAAPLPLICLLLVLVLVRMWNDLPAIIGRLTNVEAFGVKLSLSGGQAMGAALEMARKNSDWHGEAPMADQKRALDRAARERSIVEGAEILWVDDRPSNNRNEGRMLRSFGAMITFACSTDEALRALGDADEQHQPFDIILSDIARDVPDHDPKAGIAMLPRLRAAKHFQPVIFYVGRFNGDAPTPAGAFGITIRPDELLMLCLDALARVRDPRR
jgi:CheY-like chemotaxis protein